MGEWKCERCDGRWWSVSEDRELFVSDIVRRQLVNG